MMLSERVSRLLRRRVRERANGLCEYCQAPADFSGTSFYCEHIIPRKVGGENILGNLAWACPACNSTKHAKTHAHDPQTEQRVPLFNPRLKRWHRHFKWSEDLLFIIGRTRTGRATVEALNMNRLEQVNMRMALRAIGKYPPAIDSN